MPLRRSIWVLPLLGIVVIFTAGCNDSGGRLFELLEPGRTGVDFVNAIVQDDSLMNPLDYFYVYNGGGVGAGDFNGDGRPDLYFAGNVVANRLYLNRGDFRFEDATNAAGVAAEERWSTGVSLVDVNQDGLLDIYVCVGGPSENAAKRANLLFVNQGIDSEGIPRFEEQAEHYGIADTGYSTHAAFFDYDRDGDLDLYVLNTALVGEGTAALRQLPSERRAGSRDRLYRNDEDGTFTDVSDDAGIVYPGYGLGIAVADFNNDGWPDVYAANDFMPNDLLYLNNGDGSFTNRSAEVLKHQSYSSMGVDVADFNNDGLVDIIVLDMLPQDALQRRVTSNTGVLYDGEWQYGRNTLQLSNGIGPDGAVTFSEIGQLAGVAATDWSWAPLFADFDNDGFRDLFVTNGYGELVTHLDFVRRKEQVIFSGTAEENRREILNAMRALPRVIRSNVFFVNNRDLTFSQRTAVWSSERPSLSNGAAFVDLDDDGDLDLVTNNINEKAFVLKNVARDRFGANSVRVRLIGPEGNREAFGAKATLHHRGTVQYHDHSIYRGYQSTVEPVVHFGLGADSTADSLRIVWPDGASQLLSSLPVNRVVDVRYDSSARVVTGDGPPSGRNDKVGRPRALFREVAAVHGLTYVHVEEDEYDLAPSPLLPHEFSKNGPGIAVGDVDGNGLDDVFVGADPGHTGALYLQMVEGRFEKRSLDLDAQFEDMGALFFDADGDGDHDLYVVSGGSIAGSGNHLNQDRLYLNDGDGHFTRSPDALPPITDSGSSVTAADYDGDGDLDLFVGGRVRPGSYPLPPRSYLLRNDSEEDRVRFTDVTDEIAPGLGEVGLVTSALWTDFDNDDQVDLVVVGEWMPITFFKNEDGHFTNVTAAAGLHGTSGWWNSLTAGDFDRDGDMDYVAGNLGLNTRYAASSSEPVRVHAKDFDQDSRLDPVLSHYLQGTRYPAHGRDEITAQITGMIRRFPNYQAYADASFDALFTRRELEGAYVAEAVRFETSYLENRGDGTFEIRALPIHAQFAPVFGMHAGDYDGDGHLDLLMVGNFYASDVETGRADAFVGAFLLGDGAGRFTYVNYTTSGFFVDGDARGLAEVATGHGTSLLLAAQNNGPLLAFSSTQRPGRAVPLRGLDRHALLTFHDGSTRRDEFYYGSTYLSQSSRVLWVPPGVKKVIISGSDGDRHALSIPRAISAEGGQ